MEFKYVIFIARARRRNPKSLKQSRYIKNENDMKKKNFNKKLKLKKEIISNYNLNNIKGGADTSECLESIVGESCLRVCKYTFGVDCV